MRLAAVLLWTAALAGFGCRTVSPQLGGSLEFRDGNWARGQLSGHVVYRADATQRSTVLRLYWGRSSLKRLHDVPIASWSPESVPPYYYFLDGPRPSGATHLLLFAVDENGDEPNPPLALEIGDTVRSTLAFQSLTVRCVLSTDDSELRLLRSVDDLVFDQACNEQLLGLVDFSRQSVIHFAFDVACPGDSGGRIQGMKYDPAGDILEVYVHIWADNEYQANCHRDFWLAVDRPRATTEVRLVKFSACEHPATCSM